MDSYIVYRYVFPNGKIYIGVTKHDIKTRMREGYKHNEQITKAIKEFGSKSIQKEILEQDLSQEQAYEKEKHYIAYFKSNHPVFGYNISAGGKCTFEGLHHTEKHKRYMSEKYKGKVFSESHIQHLKDGHSAERIPIISIGKTGNKTIYESLGEAAVAVNGYKTNIARACKSGKAYKGYMWAYKTEVAQ